MSQSAAAARQRRAVNTRPADDHVVAEASAPLSICVSAPDQEPRSPERLRRQPDTNAMMSGQFGRSFCPNRQQGPNQRGIASGRDKCFAANRADMIGAVGDGNPMSPGRSPRRSLRRTR